MSPSEIAEIIVHLVILALLMLTPSLWWGVGGAVVVGGGFLAWKTWGARAHPAHRR